MGNHHNTKWKNAKSKGRDDQLLDHVLSWSLEDISNEGLFKDKVLWVFFLFTYIFL